MVQYNFFLFGTNGKKFLISKNNIRVKTIYNSNINFYDFLEKCLVI